MINTNTPGDKSFTPFFVADRLASLRILASVSIPKGKKVGIMTHANCTPNFFNSLKKYPCLEIYSCPLNNWNRCDFDPINAPCEKAKEMRNSLIKMCDSGVFQKEGCNYQSYAELFEKYQSAGVDYGIIIDYLKDKENTLKSAKDAINTYNKYRYGFKLVGVAQGETIEDYVDCYKELKSLGYSYVALGGMLQRKEKSARYVNVRDERLLISILNEIRKFDKDGWLFALGCYARKRHLLFIEKKVVGADYKGWIFQYNGHSPARGSIKHQEYRFTQVKKFIESEILVKSQEWREGNRLFIIPCSEHKKVFKDTAQAINVYDGPMFRLIRKHVHDFSNNNGLDIMILSGKYGLIKPTRQIKNYDQKMSLDRALELQSQNYSTLKELSEKKKYSEVIINLSPTYFAAVEPGLSLFTDSKIIYVNGRIGERLHEMKKLITS